MSEKYFFHQIKIDANNFDELVESVEPLRPVKSADTVKIPKKQPSNNSKVTKKTADPASKSYVCCGSRFLISANYQSHVNYYHGGDPSNPRIVSKLNKDLNLPTQYHCNVCQETFDTKTYLSKHFRKHRNYECETCPEVSKTFIEFKRHILTHESKIYECNDCEYATPRFRYLRSHVRRHMEKPKPKHKCPECDKVFHRLGQLMDHSNIHLNVKPYQCPKCDKSFFMKKQLSNHRVVYHPELTKRCHREKVSLKCSFCEQEFDYESGLKRHERVHRNPQIPKEFLCDICGKALSSKEHLQRHTRIHTGEKPYMCEFCSKSFSDESNLKEHRRTHTGEKPFKCDFCTKAFNQRSSLTIHKRTHTGEKPYVCQLCDKSFICRSSLTTHTKNPCHK